MQAGQDESRPLESQVPTPYQLFHPEKTVNNDVLPSSDFKMVKDSKDTRPPAA